jgi:hypothetical protein
LDDTNNKSKTRQNLHQIHNREISPKTNTKHDTNKKDLYRQLETLVQDHIETQLKHRHNGHKPYKRFSRRPSNTDLHILERHKRRIFGLIQTHVEKYIGLSTYTKNDHSTTLMCNRLRYDTPGGAESSGGRCEDFPPSAPPARHPHSQLSQSQTLPQPQGTPKPKTKMPVTRMEMLLSVLKRISRFTVDTPTHTLWNLSDHDVIFRYGQLNHLPAFANAPCTLAWMVKTLLQKYLNTCTSTASLRTY